VAGIYPQDSYSIQKGPVRILTEDETSVMVGAVCRCGEANPSRGVTPNKSRILQATIPLISKILVDDKEPSIN
jgi:hypothetical protein